MSTIAIKDRSPENVQQALAGKSEHAAEMWLRLHGYAAEHHLGLSKLSHRTGIGTSILSQGFNGTYIGDYDAIAERIESFFYRLEQNDKYGGLHEFVETAIAQSLWSVFTKTRIIRRLQIIQSPEQLGKTRAAMEYARQHNSGRTVYVSLSGGSKSGAGDFIWELAAKLDIPYTIKLREKRLRIKDKLEACDLVIVDEAHLIGSWTDRSQREFWDYLRTDVFADGKRGIVLIATNADVLQDLQLFRRRAKYNIGQILGRMRNEIIEIDPAEDVTAADVEAIMSRYYSPGKDVVEYITGITREEQLGHFGLLCDVMNEAWTTAKARRSKLSDKIVKACATEILNQQSAYQKLYRRDG